MKIRIKNFDLNKKFIIIMWFSFCNNIVWFKGLIGLDVIVYKYSIYIICKMKIFLKNIFK